MSNSVLWQHPNPTDTQIVSFLNQINAKYALAMTSYEELHKWSVTHTAEFWEEVWKFCDVIASESYTEVVDNPLKMPGAKWFTGAKLNFAENLLRYRDEKVAIITKGENAYYQETTFKQLEERVEKLATFLKKKGLQKGDRVAALMPNIEQTIVGMLATASIGAVWSSCSPDFGVEGIVTRFGQITPKVLIACDGYWFKGKVQGCKEKIESTISGIPSIQTVIVVNYTSHEEPNLGLNQVDNYDSILAKGESEPLCFEQLPFDHPLYILYSSGTTGMPKCIVHSAGGTLLQHLKEHKLHGDMTREDVFFYFTTCGWMMWNWLASGLAVGATLVCYDGAPFFPDKNALWKMAQDLKITLFGTSAKYIAACQKNEQRIKNEFDVSSIRTIYSTGSPLIAENFDYIYEHINSNVQVASIAGGTDIVSCFMLGSPISPVKRGELQCRGLGMAVESWDDSGNSIVDEQGELVCVRAFPNQPISFWNDENGEKYKAAYFDVYPNIWHHGDYITITAEGGVIIWGRSDATLNPGGVRIGTAEIYRVVESFDEIEDSLVVGQMVDGDERVILFVKLKDEKPLESKTRIALRAKIKTGCTPRHVPSVILQVSDIPYTRSGKKVEIAVKKIINGKEVDNTNALANPESLDIYRAILKEMKEEVAQPS